VFPGNIQGRHSRETGAKGCTLVTVENGEVSLVESRELDVVRWEVVRVDLAKAQDADASLDIVCQALAEELDKTGTRLLVARLILEGASPAHPALTARPEHWMQQYRAQASSLSSPGVWLEKVKFETTRLVDIEAELGRDDALGDLLRMIAGLEDAPLELEEFAQAFADLKRKLPPELTEGEEPLDPTDPATLRSAIPKVKELLLSRLLGEGGAP
jgi:hypothetical protein